MKQSSDDDLLVYNNREAALSYAARKGMKVLEERPDHLVAKTKQGKTVRLAFYDMAREEHQDAKPSP